MTTKFSTAATISSVLEYIQAIIDFPCFKFARGEPKQYDKPFLPSIWRLPGGIDDTPISRNSEYTVGELRILTTFQEEVCSGNIDDHYFNVFIRDKTEDIDIHSESLWHWTAFAQHQNRPTRLVDITRDCLIALYFASQKHDNHPGYVHIFRDNFNEINPRNIKQAVFGGSYFDLVEIKDHINGKPAPITPGKSTTTVIIPRFPNQRIEAQKGCFCFTRKRHAQAYWGGQLTFEIQDKEKIRDELRRIGYTQSSIFP